MTSLSVVESSVAYPLAAFGRVEGDWANVLGKPDVVDNALDLPDATSLMFVPQTPKTRVFTVRITVVNATEAATNDSLVQLASLLWSPNSATLFRREIPTVAHETVVDSGVETSECYAYYLTGMDAARPAPNIAVLAPQFRMLSAYWYDTVTDAAVSL